MTGCRIDHGIDASRRYLVDSDPFWPAIDLGLMRERLNLPAQVGHARLEVAARVAAARVAEEFASWRLELRGRGYRTLLDLPGDGNRPSLAQLYWRAVREATRFELERHLRLRVHPEKGAGHE